MASDSKPSVSPWRTVPALSVAVFLAAVFCTFSTMGLVGDIADLGRQIPIRFATGIILSGLFAVFYAYAGMRLRRRFWKAFLPLLALQIGAMTLLATWFPDRPLATPLTASDTARIERRLGLDSIAVTAAVSLSYVGFLFVFISEGRRHIRVHTEKAVLDREIEAAREVQQFLLPETSANFPGFRIESIYVPAQQVGGDFFQILSDSGGGLLLVVGDVAGKGLPAAMLVAMLVGVIRTATEDAPDPAKVLTRLHEHLAGRADGGFATALAAHCSPDGVVTIANGGHLPPYLDGQEVELAGALPLGVAGGGSYPTASIVLQPGVRLTFCTDGVAEARNKQGDLFGFDRTKAISTHSAAAIAETAARFGQSDDITVITLERLPLTSPAFSNHGKDSAAPPS